MYRWAARALLSLILIVSPLPGLVAASSPVLFIADVTIEEDEIPSLEVDLAYVFSQVTIQAVKERYLYPITTFEDADIILEPVIESIEHSYDSSNRLEVIRMDIRWDVSGTLGSGSISFPCLGTGGTADAALLGCLKLYETSVGYEISRFITGDGFLLVSSLFNGYITAALSGEEGYERGDTFLILDPSGGRELGALTISDLYETEEGLPKAAEFSINYTNVPIQAGLALFPKEGDAGLSLRLGVLQSLGYTGLSGKVIIRRPQGLMQYAAGVDVGFSWTDSPFGLPWPIEASGFHLGITQGFLARFETGSNLFFDIGADLGLGVYLDSSGTDSDWTCGGSYHAGIGRYGSSDHEFGLDIGYEQVFGLSGGTTLLKSTPYLSPHVTFRL